MTSNEPSAVDSADFTVRRTITIAASPDKVWAAITEPEHIVGWFGQGATLDALAVGADGVFSFDGFGDQAIRIEELDAPRMIAYRWSEAAGPLDADHSTVFRFTLEPQGGGTRLTVVESGFSTLADPAASMEDHRGGWDSELDELVAYLEGGS
jgi:uncharacterized protein YndB with AHSA1/START domain